MNTFILFFFFSVALNQLNKPTRRANHQATNIAIIYTMRAAGNTLSSEILHEPVSDSDINSDYKSTKSYSTTI